MQQCKITREDVATLLSNMVAIPSINPALHKPEFPADLFGENAVAAFIATWLEAEGIEVEIEDVLPERPNVIARIVGEYGSPRMIWEGHKDTLQVDGMTSPFAPRIDGA